MSDNDPPNGLPRTCQTSYPTRPEDVARAVMQPCHKPAGDISTTVSIKGARFSYTHKVELEWRTEIKIKEEMDNAQTRI